MHCTTSESNHRFSPSLDVGLQVARAQRVGTLLALTTEIYGDTAVLEVLLYDVSGGHEVRRPIQITAPVSDIDGLVAPVTLEILQLRDFQLPLGTLLTESSSPHALREFQAGLDALYAWRLPEAEEHFREAIAAGLVIPSGSLPGAHALLDHVQERGSES